jgi:hypothetical protein
MAQVSLPTKTKIAAWIMMVIGGIGTIGGLLIANVGHRHPTAEFDMFFSFLGMTVFLPSSLYFFSGLLLLLARKRITWVFSVGASSMEMVFSLVVTCYFVRLLIDGWLDIRDLLIGDIYSLQFIVYLYVLVLALFSLFTLILVLVDRKNYWKIAS